MKLFRRRRDKKPAETSAAPAPDTDASTTPDSAAPSEAAPAAPPEAAPGVAPEPVAGREAPTATPPGDVPVADRDGVAASAAAPAAGTTPASAIATVAPSPAPGAAPAAAVPEPPMPPAEPGSASAPASAPHDAGGSAPGAASDSADAAASAGIATAISTTQPGGDPASADEAPAKSSPPAATAPKRPPEKPAEKPSSGGFFGRLRRGLGRTSDNLVAGFGNLFLGRKTIDADLLEELESLLLMADVGIEATTEIIENLTARVSRKELTEPDALMKALREELRVILEPCERPLDFTAAAPFVILMVGVNGVGKTTTIGKLARRLQSEGKSVMLAAGDTFRAAAVEQLQTWGERNQVPVIAQHTGADSASVIYDALQAATSRGVDVLIADTAGRLHNKSHLMDELRKVVRVMGKINPAAPHEVMLVLDAGTGQNALAQAAQFTEAVGVSGITLTKLDGTAKGGVIFAIARQLGLPIRFIGVGESAEDLRNFAADEFIQALFDRE